MSEVCNQKRKNHWNDAVKIKITERQPVDGEMSSDGDDLEMMANGFQIQIRCRLDFGGSGRVQPSAS